MNPMEPMEAARRGYGAREVDDRIERLVEENRARRPGHDPTMTILYPDSPFQLHDRIVERGHEDRGSREVIAIAVGQHITVQGARRKHEIKWSRLRQYRLANE